MDDAAVSISGEAFTILAVLFVAAMLLIVLLRARAKSRSRPPARLRSASDRSYGGDGGVHPGQADGGKRTDPDGPGADSGDGGGDGGGGGD